MQWITKNWKSFIAAIALLLGGGVAGRYTVRTKDIGPEVVLPTKFVAKAGKLNVLSVVTELPFKFFTDSKEEFRVCGKDFIFSPATPMNVWVFAVKDGLPLDPLRCSVELDGPAPEPLPNPNPGPGPGPGPPPNPPPPPLPTPTTPIEKAIVTAWQQDFTPNKATYLPKFIDMYQAMLSGVETAETWGNVSAIMVEKNKAIPAGVCPVLAAAINAELGKVFPRSPSVLIDKAVARDNLGQVIAALKKLT